MEWAVAGHAFISYSREDSAYVHQLVAYLEARGVPVWRDDGVDYGDRWAEVVQAQVDSCAVFVLVMSPASAGSAWVEREIARAEQQRRPIAPMLLAGRPLFRVGNIQYVDVTGGVMPPERFVEGLRRLTSPTAPNLAPAQFAGPAVPSAATPEGPTVGIPVPIPASQPGTTPRRRRSRWPVVILVVALLCCGGVVSVYYFGNWVADQLTLPFNLPFPFFGRTPVIAPLQDQSTTERLASQVSQTSETLTVTITSVRTNATYTSTPGTYGLRRQIR
jgi:hypothetical protein